MLKCFVMFLIWIFGISLMKKGTQDSYISQMIYETLLTQYANTSVEIFDICFNYIFHSL